MYMGGRHIKIQELSKSRGKGVDAHDDIRSIEFNDCLLGANCNTPCIVVHFYEKKVNRHIA